MKCPFLCSYYVAIACQVLSQSWDGRVNKTDTILILPDLNSLAVRESDMTERLGTAQSDANEKHSKKCYFICGSTWKKKWMWKITNIA